ncbi:MAG: CHAT domain-containing protein [Candidatus Solibacter usitatus]|nr:CHAT domain-containing protein [Candidatus Solibacter usitatus]
MAPAPGGDRDDPLLASTYARATRAYQRGDYREAGQLFAESHRAAVRSNHPQVAVRSLWYVGNCHFAQGSYHEALRVYLELRESLEKRGDTFQASVLSANIASIYSELGEQDSAIAVVEEALRAVPAGPRRPRAELYLLKGGALARQGQLDLALAPYRQAIAEARRSGELSVCANAYSGMGYELMLRGRLAEAEAAILEGYRLRKEHHLPHLESSLRNLGLLRLSQGRLAEAGGLLEDAVARKGNQGGMPLWQYLHARGRARAATGNLPGALADFRAAVERVRSQRLLSPSADLLRVGAEGTVQAVYDSLVEAAVRSYFQRRDPDLLRETFEAVEENRAWSLVSRSDERSEWRANLPREYWDLLAQLRAAEGAETADIVRVREALLRSELKAGSRRPAGIDRLLERTRQFLPADTVLLSFHLGLPESYLWAVSHSRTALYRLPPKTRISEAVWYFRQAVEQGARGQEELGRALHDLLFGSLGRVYRERSRWLLSLDDALFELPWAALVAGGAAGSPEYLVDRHSLQIVSGALMLLQARSGRPDFSGAFVGIADPIYNTADPRWRPLSGARLRTPPARLARLAASGAEIQACIAGWPGRVVLLEGAGARKERIRAAVESQPAVVHFATHVLRDVRRPDTASLALGLNEQGENEYLGTAELPAWKADAGLVVLSGCGSGAGVALPASGLMGLTRAWLMAGARGVLASYWATPDDTGALFLRFYEHLRKDPMAGPAAALRGAQRDMISSREWRAQPRYWAAYAVMGHY